MKAKFVRAARAPHCAPARAASVLQICAAVLLLSALALPQAAFADGCTPVTSSGSPVTNSIVTCTGVTTNQNVAFGLNNGYGTFNETGNTIDVQTMASVTGDFFGFALADGNTINNSGAILGDSDGIIITSGSTITVNNLTGSSTISGTINSGLIVDNVVVSNAGTITGAFTGIRAVGSVTLASNTGSITGTFANSEGIFADSVSGSNAGTISGVNGIDTQFGNGITLTSNSGTIQANGGFAINAKGDVFIGSNSGNIASDGLGTNFARAINAGGSVTVTNTSTGNITATDALVGAGEAIVAVGDATVVNSGNIAGEQRAIDAQSNSSTSLNLTNNFGGSITGDNGEAVESFGTAAITNSGTIGSTNGNGVFISDGSITNTTTGIIESNGTNAEAVIADSLILNNAGIVTVTNTIFFAVDATTIEAGSTNTGTISGNVGAISSDRSLDIENSGTITAALRGLQAKDVDITNSGTISATGGPGFEALTNQVIAVLTDTGAITNFGNITATGGPGQVTFAFAAATANVTNSGTITADSGSGLAAFAIVADGANVTNTASGIISATGTSVFNDAINTDTTTLVDNFGLISSTGRTGVRASGDATIINETGGTIVGVSGIVVRDGGVGFGAPANTSIVNESGGTITGVMGIVFRDGAVNGSVFNAGTITGTGGVAINFDLTLDSGPMTLTLAPGSVINGLVLGTGADTFQLGGSGSDTFDVDNIGASQQYQGFTSFNKIGSSTWTLTGTGSQSWNIVSGTLIGDTFTFSADIANNGTIEFAQDFNGTYTNVISGTGNFIKDGTGVLELANDNTYTGGTTISGGTLVLGRRGFGFGGSIVGDVADNGELDVNRPDALTLSGVISGTGSFVQAGSGTTTLTGANSYTGGTFVNNGSLQLGDAGDHTSILGPISVSNGANLLVLNADTSQVTTVTLDNGSALFELFTNAGTAQINATNNGAISFFNNATAEQSQISLDQSTAGFQDSASAASATISADNSSMIVFLGLSTAATSTIDLRGPSSLVFFNSSTAANAQISSSGTNAQLAFMQNSTAAQATIMLSQPGVLEFNDMASADQAHIVTTAIATIEFLRASTAANAQIDATVGGVVLFDNASAGQAQITLGGNASLSFLGNASGGSAAVATGLGTTLFISGLTNGGTTLASLNGAGSVVLGTNILTIGSDNSDSTISGSITGLGGLTKIGTGTLTLAGNNFFTGVTTISGGTLQVGDGGSTGNIGGDIVDNAALVFDLSGFVTVPGAISGTGSLAQIGSGTTILTGNNTYSGGTTITSGTLQVGGAGTTGSIVGDVLNAGTLAFARSDNTAFAGVISGSGGVALVSSGTVTLTGANSYAGGTTISAGTLQVGNGGTSGLIVGDAVDNAMLAFDRSDNITFSGLISGSGGLIQDGTGSLTLTGQNAYTGGTTISAGTLQIGNGGTAGSIVGDVADNGTLVFDRTDSLTFAGTVFGSGSLAQIGTATLILTSTNTYTGGTTISSGTLQLGIGGTAGSIIGDVVDDGTLIFDRSDTVTFPGAISGSGDVVQNGSGTLILTGTSSYTGTTTVNAGILDVNGSIANSAVTANRSTTLKGNGTVGPLTLTTGATVAPGNSIGTLHVAGSVSFATGSTYSVEVNPAGQSDLIAATGAATIAPGALVDISAAAGIYAAQTRYVILTAAGGVTGTFAAPTINLSFVIPELIYQPTEVDLLLKLRDINLIPPAHTPNQISTAVAVKAGGPQSVIFGQFLQDSVNGLGFVTDALDQLSGEIHPSLVTSELEDDRLVRLAVLSRLRQAATGDASSMLAPAPAEAREIVDGVSMWTRALADWGTIGSDGNVATLDQVLSGIFAGIDARIGAVTIGVAGGYGHSHANQRTSTAKGGNAYVGAYGGWVDGAWALRVGGTYGWGNRDILRTVTFPGFAQTLTSKEDQHGSQLFGEVAYAANTEHLSFEPFAGIAWEDASTAHFVEKGGAAALSGTGGDASLARSSVGVRLAAVSGDVGALAVTPRASIAWEHAFGGLHPGQLLTFEDTGERFFILGSTIDTDSANITLGLDARIGSGGTLSLGYDGLLSSRVRLNTIHAGLNWNF